MKNINIADKKQQGAASIVFVMLISLVVLASTSKAFKDVKNTQEIGTAINAVSHAESGTRFAAEAFRAYLESLSSSNIRRLPGNSPLSITAADPNIGSLTAENISVVETSADAFQINAVFVNRHRASRSSAKLQVVYGVGEDAGDPPVQPPKGTLHFGSGVDISGSVTVVNIGNPVDIAVDNDLKIGNVNLVGIRDIFSTGKVEIDSNTEVRAIYADGDVRIDNTDVDLIRSMGSVRTTGDAAAQTIHTNEDVLIESSGTFDRVAARGNINVTGGADLGHLTAGVDIDSVASLELAEAIGDVRYHQWFRADRTVTMGDITCVSISWREADSIAANGSFNNTCAESQGSYSAAEGASNIVQLPQEVPPINLAKPPRVNVWALKESANYFVEYDDSIGEMVVTVKSVNGLIDGHTYIIGKFNSNPPYYDSLCLTIDSSGNCTSPSAPTAPICTGHSIYNKCINYNPNTQTFTLNPSRSAPGVIFFDGNVLLNNGDSFTTILASGHINTNGGFKHRAANAGGYEVICNGETTTSVDRNRYREVYSRHYPTNLCDRSTGSYEPSSTGNIGLAAGGINPDVEVNPDQVFTGGDINLSGSSQIVGAVLAGNTIIANSGDVDIQGVVSAGGQLNDGSASSIAASTTIDYNTDDDYDPFDIPEMDTPTVPEATGPVIKVATMLWSRPL